MSLTPSAHRAPAGVRPAHPRAARAHPEQLHLAEPHLARAHLTRRGWLAGSARAVGAAALAGALPLAACTSWPPPTTPMPVRRIAARCAVATQRVILLPGALSRAEEFVGEGFVAELHAAVPGCEVLLADAHLGYFVEGQLLERLRADAVQPGRDGAIEPWLVGISLGGFAALAYAAQHGNELAGVLALAPYLGRRELLRDISAAGGPQAWSTLPGAPREPYEAIEEDVWRWLAHRAVVARGASTTATPTTATPTIATPTIATPTAAAPTAPASPAPDAPPVFLGYGAQDRFADAHRVLQSLLPAERSMVVPGGHDWPPWRVLWQRWLRQGWLAKAGAGCQASGRLPPGGGARWVV